jgi:hypothetical protein
MLMLHANLSPALILVSAQLVFGLFEQARARPIEYEYSCNICRDSPQGKREVINLSKSFKQQGNGVTMTCGQLQESVQDLNPISGAPGEARLCATSQ